MTYGELEAFLTIVELNSFSAASNALFITQPALSRKISYLENELGYTLFIRNKGVRNVYLTEEGKAFVNIAINLKSLMENSKNIGNYGKKRLYIAASDNLSFSSNLYNIINNLDTDTSRINFKFSNHETSDIYSMLEKGSVNLGIITDPQYSNIIETVPLFEERMVVYSNKKISGSTTISSSMLDHTNEIYVPWSSAIESWHKLTFGSEIAPKVHLQNSALIPEFLKLDNIWFLCPYPSNNLVTEKDGLYMYELTNPPPDRTVYYLKHEHSYNELIDSFIKKCQYLYEHHEKIRMYY